MNAPDDDDTLLQALVNNAAAVVRRGWPHLPAAAKEAAMSALAVEVRPGRPDRRREPAIVVWCYGPGDDAARVELFRLQGQRRAEH